jgi:hypothetical protein
MSKRSLLDKIIFKNLFLKANMILENIDESANPCKNIISNFSII